MKDSYDVVVVGAGAAGMMAALTAAQRGLDTVLVEKSGYFGGSTARSGGGVWIPGNYALRAAGQVEPDDPSRAADYLDAIVGAGSTKARRTAFLEHGAATMDLIRALTPLRFAWVPDYADYLPEQPGGRAKGRSVEPVPLDARFLGAELDRLHPPYTKAPANLIITQADYRKISLGLRTWRGPATMAKALARRAIAMARGERRYAMGNALAIGLRKGLLDAGVEISYETPLVDLEFGADPSEPNRPRVTGAVVEREGVRRTIRARYAVILGSGGFEHNQALREQHLPQPTATDWSTGAPSNTGDGLLIGTAAGADTALLDEAWWGPTIPLPSQAWFCLAERNLPGSIIVNSAGHRFMNEALPYVEATHEIYRGEATGTSHVPAYLIFDQTYRDRYLFAGVPGRQKLPGRWYKSGVVTRADSLTELATAIKLDPATLSASVARFNGFARSGIDEDFGRGRSAYDKYYSDPRVRPNPSLAPLLRGPFYAVKIVPGDLGTKGGLVTDERARVLRRDGTPIAGLYASGNVSASVMGTTYPGPGGTIGPALVFGYLAALDAAATAEQTAPRTGPQRTQPHAD